MINDLDMGKIYKYRINDRTLALKCVILCVLMLAVSGVAGISRESFNSCLGGFDHSFSAGVHAEAIEVKSESRMENWQPVKNSGEISESRALNLGTERIYAVFIAFLTAVLLCLFFCFSEKNCIANCESRTSIIHYMQAQDGCK